MESSEAQEILAQLKELREEVAILSNYITRNLRPPSELEEG